MTEKSKDVGISDNTVETYIGILLSGGRSRRFGSDKLKERIRGVEVAQMSARSLVEVCPSSFEAGSELTELPQIPGTLGNGPLAAIATCFQYLKNRYPLQIAGAIVLAADMPFIRQSTLAILLNWPGQASLVPVVNGRAQYLAARWSRESLERSVSLVHNERLRVSEALNLPGTQWLSTDKWEKKDTVDFIDIDTREDLTEACMRRSCSIDERRK